MTKQLNEAALGNELKASSFFVKAQAADAPAPPQVAASKTKASRKTPEAPETPAEEAETSKAARVGKVDSSAILGRPKAFYITAEQDKDLDTLVAEISLRLAGRLNFKVDRSVVVRLILESSNLTDKATVSRLADEFVSRLVSRLTG